MDDKLRIDKYLWAIRLFKTRALAARACRHGKVRLSEKPVKAARVVAAGEIYVVRTPGGQRIVEVLALPSQRVSAVDAPTYFRDRTPVVPPAAKRALGFYPPGRPAGSGRPTKKERRNLDDFMDHG